MTIAITTTAVTNLPSGSDKVEILQSLGFQTVSTVGDHTILERPLLGLLCSIRCPGQAILESYDLTRELRDSGVPVISGFHTPMEKECLELLLRGAQQVVACPARSLEGMRIPSPQRAAVAEGRLLLLSPFAKTHRRATSKLAEARNRVVVALATDVFVAYAAPHGNVEKLCRELLASGKSVVALDIPQNSHLIDTGCTPVTATTLVQHWHATPTWIASDSVDYAAGSCQRAHRIRSRL